jgi:hypothetical protein
MYTQIRPFPPKKHPSQRGNQRRLGWGFVVCQFPGVPVFKVAARATSACRNRPPPTSSNGCRRQQTCRLWGWRHPHAVVGLGGTFHVSPGQTCRHRQVVFFAKKFQTWSFLTLHQAGIFTIITIGWSWNVVAKKYSLRACLRFHTSLPFFVMIPIMQSVIAFLTTSPPAETVNREKPTRSVHTCNTNGWKSKHIYLRHVQVTFCDLQSSVQERTLCSV